MGVATGHADLRVAKDLHHHALVDALREQQGGSRVPGVMNANLADSGRSEQRSPFIPVGVVTDRPSVGLAPDEVAVVPGWPGGHALKKLGGPVRLERRDELGWQRYRAPALIGLEFGEVESAAGSLRARAGVASAAGRAVVAVTVLATGARVRAAMLPGEALELPADGQRSGVKIDVLPP